MPRTEIPIIISMPWFSGPVADGVARALQAELTRYAQSGEQFPYLPEVLSKALRIALQTSGQVKKPEQFSFHETAPDIFRLSWRPHTPGKRSLGKLPWELRGGNKRQRPMELVYGEADDPGRIVIPQMAHAWGFRAKLLTGEYRSYRWEKVRTWHALKDQPFANARLELLISLPEKRSLKGLRGIHLKLAETLNRTERPNVQVRTTGYTMRERMTTTWY